MHIFRAGTRQDANGQVVTITPEDLAKSAQAYDPAKHEAPIVVGHPQQDDPAYGWIQSLQATGADLVATPQQLDPQFSELVQAGRFKKISASFYLPDASANPVPGVFYLRHVGFLGATPPAVKGLKAVEFGANPDDGTVEFADWADSTFLSFFRGLRDFMIDQFGMDSADKVIPPFMLENLQAELVLSQVKQPDVMPMFSDPPQPPLTRGAETLNGVPMSDNNETPNQTTDFADRESAVAAKEAELKAREIAIQRQELANFAEGLVQAGKLLPAQKSAAVELLANLSLQPETVNFGESQTTLKDLFKGFLEAQPKIVNYSEVAGADKEPADLSKDPVKLARRISEYRDAEMAKGNTISFAEAHAAVLAE